MEKLFLDFQDLYKQNGDALYSQIVAVNTPKEFSNPSPVLGELKQITKRSKIPGQPDTIEYYREQTITDRKTKNISKNVHFNITHRANLELQQQQQTNDMVLFRKF